MKINVVGEKSNNGPSLEIRPETNTELLSLIKLTNELVSNKISAKLQKAHVPNSLSANTVENLALYVSLKENKKRPL